MGLPGTVTFEREFVRCIQVNDRVRVLVLDRPRANALSRQVLAEIAEAADHLHEDPPGAVVIWGGQRIFAAGGDIGEMGGADDARRLVDLFRQAYDRVASIPRMVIAAINGYALGGGCELALACDFRVVGEKAKIGLPEIQLGLIPAAGGTQRLTRLVGPARAKEMLVSGRHVPAHEARDIGLVDRVVSDEAVLESAVSWASEFAEGPVLAQAAAKRMVEVALAQPLSTGLDEEGEAAIALHYTDDARVGVQSFLEHGPGKAVFTGR